MKNECFNLTEAIDKLNNSKEKARQFDIPNNEFIDFSKEIPKNLIFAPMYHFEKPIYFVMNK